MKIVIILLILYILSVYVGRKWLGKAYSKGGRWSNINPGSTDIFVIFWPGLNFGMLIVCLLISPLKKDPIDYNKFFKIKK